MNEVPVVYILTWIANRIALAATELMYDKPGYALSTIGTVFGPLILLGDYETNGGQLSKEELERYRHLDKWYAETSTRIHEAITKAEEE